jgi:hypothetical protein
MEREAEELDPLVLERVGAVIDVLLGAVDHEHGIDVGRGVEK